MAGSHKPWSSCKTNFPDNCWKNKMVGGLWRALMKTFWSKWLRTQLRNVLSWTSLWQIGKGNIIGRCEGCTQPCLQRPWRSGYGWCKWPYLRRKVGQNDFQKSLPTSTMPWFYNSILVSLNTHTYCYRRLLSMYLSTSVQPSVWMTCWFE